MGLSRFEQSRELRAQGRHCRLDRLGILDGFRRGFITPAREQWRNQAMRVAALLLDRLEVELQAAQRLRQKIELIAGNLGLGHRVSVDALVAEREESIGLVEAEHAQRAMNLPALLGERCERRSLGFIAQEFIERFLDAMQIRADLMPDLRQDHALLRTLAQVA